MRKIAIANHKGGCGKTTTTINLGYSLSRLGYRVLIADFDPQGHCAVGLGLDYEEPETTLADILLEPSPRTKLDRLIVPIVPNLDLIPSNVRLATVEPRLVNQQGREQRLANALQNMNAEYDFLLVDCPPNLGLLTFNAVFACDEVLSPVESSIYSADGLNRFQDTVDLINRHCPTPRKLQVLLTCCDPRTRFTRSLYQALETRFPGRVFETQIVRSVRFCESAERGQPVALYAPTCRGAESYHQLATEIAGHSAQVSPDALPKHQAKVAPQVSRAAEAPPLSVEEGASWQTAPSAPPSPEKTDTPAPATGVATSDEGLPSDELEPVGDRVLFQFTRPEAAAVRLVGDFNNWDEAGLAMQQDSKGVWRATLFLPHGSYQYRFLSDGEWFEDPKNTEKIVNPFGERNSIIRVPA